MTAFLRNLVFCISFVICVLPAEAATPVQSETFQFSGVCNGNQQLNTFFITTPGAVTVIGGDISIFSNPQGGIDFAYVATLPASGIASTELVNLGLGQTHVRSFFPSGTGITAFSNGFAFSLSCNPGAGAWSALVTVWFTPT
jgi:hypothetical protein